MREQRNTKTKEVTVMRILMNSGRHLTQRLMEAYISKCGLQAAVVSTSDRDTAAEIVQCCGIGILACYSEHPESDNLAGFLDRMLGLNPDIIILLFVDADNNDKLDVIVRAYADETIVLPADPCELLNSLRRAAKQYELHAQSLPANETAAAQQGLPVIPSARPTPQSGYGCSPEEEAVSAFGYTARKNAAQADAGKTEGGSLFNYPFVKTEFEDIDFDMPKEQTGEPALYGAPAPENSFFSAANAYGNAKSPPEKSAEYITAGHPSQPADAGLPESGTVTGKETVYSPAVFEGTGVPRVENNSCEQPAAKSGVRRSKKSPLRHLNKTELLEIMLLQEKGLDELEKRVEELDGMLKNRETALAEPGSIAQAALRLNNVFESAQKPAAQYMESVRAAGLTADI